MAGELSLLHVRYITFRLSNTYVGPACVYALTGVVDVVLFSWTRNLIRGNVTQTSSGAQSGSSGPIGFSASRSDASRKWGRKQSSHAESGLDSLGELNII